MRKRAGRPLQSRDFAFPLIAAAALFLLTMAAEGGFTPDGPADLWRAVCDGLTVPGVLLTGMALLRTVSSQGAFDALRFGTRKVLDQLRREEKRARTPKTYYDYVQVRREQPEKHSGALLAVGLLCLLGAGMTLAVYLRLP